MSEAPGLIRLAAVDPRRAYATAAGLATAGDPAVRVEALRALGLACKELGRLAEGLGHLRDASDVARSAGLGYAAAQVKMNLVGLLAAHGDVDAALAAADEAAGVLRGADADRLLANRAYVLARSGRITEVARIARTCTDPEVLVGLRVNIGLAKAYAGKLGRGEADLRAALAIAERAGLRHQAAMVRHNLAVVAQRRGDLPRALALYEDIEAELADVGERLCQLRLDRAEALIAARLPGEARELLADTLDRLSSGGYGSDAADAMLLLAHAELADGDPRAAAATARRARAAFAERTGSALLAERIGLRARWASGDRSAGLLADAERAAERLDRAGWAADAADARILAALVALAHDRRDHAEHLLAGGCGHEPDRPRGTPVTRAAGLTLPGRVAAWHATALLRLSGGDRRGAAAAVRAGLRVVDEHAAALGAAELRGQAAGWAAELADLGLRLASGPRALLAAAERARAIADRPPAVRPPPDRKLAGLLAELRRVAAMPDRPEPRARLEDAVRARTRRLPSNRPAVRGWARLVPELLAALEAKVFAEFVRCGDELLAVTVADGRCRRRSLGPCARVHHDARLLRFALARLARDPGCAAAHGLLTAAAGRLDAALLGPLRLGDRPVVLAPAGMLHGLPWPALPSLRGRALTVVPSAASWLRALQTPIHREASLPVCPENPAPARPKNSAPVRSKDSAPVRPDDSTSVHPADFAPVDAAGGRGRVVLVAGPGLEHADGEVAAARACHPGAVVLTGSAATEGAVRSALDGAAVAHLAAHGVFRSGNALFSSIRLVDGPLLAYDLERLERPPRLLVLSACDAGSTDVRAGEAVMGLVSTALSFGTATVIAAVGPVNDAATRDLMTGLHERLALGMPPAEALAAAPRPRGALGFGCFGGGFT